MNERFILAVITAALAIGGLLWFWHQTNLGATLALIFVIWANNIGMMFFSENLRKDKENEDADKSE